MQRKIQLERRQKACRLCDVALRLLESKQPTDKRNTFWRLESMQKMVILYEKWLSMSTSLHSRLETVAKPIPAVLPWSLGSLWRDIAASTRPEGSMRSSYDPQYMQKMLMVCLDGPPCHPLCRRACRAVERPQHQHCFKECSSHSEHLLFLRGYQD